MTANDYPITFPFGSTKPPYSIDHIHSGEDRAMPVGTPVVVDNTIIGLSGNTGKTTGPHLHIQKAVLIDGQWKFTSPQGAGFGLPRPLQIVEVGFKSDIGNFVRLIDANGIRWSYFHLSSYNVVVGQKIGVVNMQPISANQQDKAIKGMLGRDPTEVELNDMNWRNNAGLMIDTLWENGAKQRYEAKDQIATKPSADEVKSVFKQYQVSGPTDEQITYYTQRSWDGLLNDILGDVWKRYINLTSDVSDGVEYNKLKSSFKKLLS